MDAADGMEQLFAAHTAVPALDVLQQLRKGVSQQQAQALLNIHREYLQLSMCSFGRRGRPSYAFRTEAEVQRLCNIANISVPECRLPSTKDRGSHLKNQPSIHVPLQMKTRRASGRRMSVSVYVVRREPRGGILVVMAVVYRMTAHLHRDISGCAVMPLDAHATCLDCMHHALIAMGATDVPAPDILLATVVGAITESWDMMRFQVLHAHASSLPSTCTVEQYGEALQQHRLLPGAIELAVLTHALNIALTVFDPDGLQMCYWGSSTAPMEVCLIRQMGLAGTPVSYHLLDLVPANSGNERAEFLVFHPPDYTKAIVSLDTIDHLWIGLVDVGLGFFPAAFGFVAAKLRQQHCMEALVLDWAHDSTRRVNMLPPALQELNLAVATDGTPLDYRFGLSAEMAMFPYLFPFGAGAFMGDTTLVKYLAYRANSSGGGGGGAGAMFVASPTRGVRRAGAVLLQQQQQQQLGVFDSLQPPQQQQVAAAAADPPLHPSIGYFKMSPPNSMGSSSGTRGPASHTRNSHHGSAGGAFGSVAMLFPTLRHGASADDLPGGASAAATAPSSPPPPGPLSPRYPPASGSSTPYAGVTGGGGGGGHLLGLDVARMSISVGAAATAGATGGGAAPSLARDSLHSAVMSEPDTERVEAASIKCVAEFPDWRIGSQGVCAVLESVLLDYKSQHPNVSDEDAIHHILKHKLPATLPNTPAWHRSNLQDLLCMVDRLGMPSFFLTLTTDEVSATRWPEVESLEQKMQDFCAGFTWQDAPAENAFITHKRVQSFMTDVLKAGRGAVQAGGALSCVTNWVRINSASWSFYMLKYTMKTEPVGNVDLTAVSCVALGVPADSSTGAAGRDYFVRLISAYLASIVISPTLAYLTAANIHTVTMSAGVQYIDSSPPTSCTRHVLQTGPIGKACGHLDLSMPPDAVVTAILAQQAGIVVLSDGPGCGKTFVTKKLTRLLQAAGKSVHLSASTGAAAVRLSQFATTNHTAFNLPVSQQHRPTACMREMRTTDVRVLVLQAADVLILDEFSMMTAENLMHILITLWHASEEPSINAMLRKKLIILVGDDAQLAPVCKHQCTHEDEPPATAAELDAVFGVCAPDNMHFIGESQVAATCNANATVLCTHQEDALQHNLTILRCLEGTALGKVCPCPLSHNVTAPDAMLALDQWLQEPTFRTLPCMAIGVLVCLTDNVSLARGAANGTTGNVAELLFDADGHVDKVKVQLATTGKTLGCSVTRYKILNGV
ncbi:hypothetical protein VOLCADRAFT_86633 [Volvox carteri f. nagariensis]|uniref:ATP-dependent DNA helicase n=1 Tax=Volvox carteri f. nagariensis TaxID=3068 RepID=D8TJ69_VOLCA|nr:uncharacterized protein VOLCADRAFT_86633 [Volvox carteri f. nagariensis]EFJ52324.1 hypothetical protein VOLCADRAFT_86633 [Volvox carteri f. nagariensis]|eukprot:XP_002946397.1 hypothetical protein VOLCADRAFT_86633 [Volvox carteri f. nagariensis]